MLARDVALAVRLNNPPFARTLPEDTACGQRPRRCGGAGQRLGRSRRRGSSGRRPHPTLPGGPRRSLRVFRTAGHTASGSWGGDRALAGGDRGGRRPRFRSTSSAVRRVVMTATTRRLPPQGHCQTSAPKVLRCKEARSSRGRLGLSASRTPPAPLPGTGASATPSFSRALTTPARSFAFGASSPAAAPPAPRGGANAARLRRTRRPERRRAPPWPSPTGAFGPPQAGQTAAAEEAQAARPPGPRRSPPPPARFTSCGRASRSAQASASTLARIHRTPDFQCCAWCLGRLLLRGLLGLLLCLQRCRLLGQISGTAGVGDAVVRHRQLARSAQRFPRRSTPPQRWCGGRAELRGELSAERLLVLVRGVSSDSTCRTRANSSRRWRRAIAP
jgi:hypothetical protein